MRLPEASVPTRWQAGRLRSCSRRGSGAAHPEEAQEQLTQELTPACGAGAKEPAAVAQPKEAGLNQPGGHWIEAPGTPENTDPFSLLQRRTTRTYKCDHEVTRLAYL
jgi:hypothetical protein